jgi:hypothetical protein
MLIYIIALFSILLSCCSPQLVASPSVTENPLTGQLTEANTPHPPKDEIISLVTNDLSTRLSTEIDLIQVISVKVALWPDTSLGCPRPGEVYTEKTVHGYQVWLEANDQIYIYHTDNNDNIILCTESELPAFPVTPGEIDDGEPWMPAD